MKGNMIKTAIRCLIAGFILIGYGTAFCVVPVEIPEIVMRTTAGNVRIGLGGDGTASVDWGDGTRRTLSLTEDMVYIEHAYTASSGSHSIKITGTGITGLDCQRNQLSALDVGKNTVLRELVCSINQLRALDVGKNTELRELVCRSNPLSALDVGKNTELRLLSCDNCTLSALDVGKNTVLTWLDCPFNQLSAAALEALFGSLHGNTMPEKIIRITGNPGENRCDRSIARNRGWTLDESLEP
jgi:hypothetical protein